MKPLSTSLPEIFNYNIFSTVIGWGGIVWKNNAIVRLYLPMRDRSLLERFIIKEFERVIEEKFPPLQENIKKIEGYFLGKKGDLVAKLDLSGSTPFQRRVYTTTQLIPYGEVRCYKWVSDRMNECNSSRAAGNALSKNPVPLYIPCHRVIKSNGDIGGFTAQEGGVCLKRKMLELEAANRTGTPDIF